MLERITGEGWDKLVLEWEEECSSFEEDFGDYAVASLPVLAELARAAPRRDAAVYGLMSDGKVDVVCQANSTLLPGYTGKVLRVRHIVLAPRFDFSEDITIEAYTETLANVFAGVLGLADDVMPSDHIKFHLKSPAEKSFGGAFTDALSGHPAFSLVAMKGSWIYLSKV
ncbi:hypothetical protein SAMN05216376_11232 [Mameliella alba]|uniref:hypothetical protein n=1 Tax=Mameliella alba TaxID=561184 RepID=UPI00088E8B42|nr:hypothetical protein [Mameliella alba]OWV46154.1 hypothetical protein CDZ96_19930 [Mameliella alba]PTR37001.1 hypothetical protein LX94_03793 [Mameliella alba]GGF77034.1 hypothetical protein GCM10011319_41730 [Mameliella alba]SDD81664.1 hypothetical protein SAMN05216376_11232 [Mameliella alba]